MCGDTTARLSQASATVAFMYAPTARVGTGMRCGKFEFLRCVAASKPHRPHHSRDNSNDRIVCRTRNRGDYGANIHRPPVRAAHELPPVRSERVHRSTSAGCRDQRGAEVPRAVNDAAGCKGASGRVPPQPRRYRGGDEAVRTQPQEYDWSHGVTTSAAACKDDNSARPRTRSSPSAPHQGDHDRQWLPRSSLAQSQPGDRASFEGIAKPGDNHRRRAARQSCHAAEPRSRRPVTRPSPWSMRVSSRQVRLGPHAAQARGSGNESVDRADRHTRLHTHRIA